MGVPTRRFRNRGYAREQNAGWTWLLRPSNRGSDWKIGWNSRKKRLQLTTPSRGRTRPPEVRIHGKKIQEASGEAGRGASSAGSAGAGAGWLVHLRVRLKPETG